MNSRLEKYYNYIVDDLIKDTKVVIPSMTSVPIMDMDNVSKDVKDIFRQGYLKDTFTFIHNSDPSNWNNFQYYTFYFFKSHLNTFLQQKFGVREDDLRPIYVLFKNRLNELYNKWMKD